MVYQSTNLGKLLSDMLVGADQSGMSESGLRGELELLVGKTYLGEGLLERAGEFFVAASDHVIGPAQRTELAGQMITLGRVWTRQTQQPEARQHAEDMFRRAVPLAPAQGLPALAQHLQREQRLSDAIEVWSEVLRAAPQSAPAYLNLARLYEQTNQTERALTTYLRLIDVAPSAGNYLVVAQRLDELQPVPLGSGANRKVKVALLGNATLDHLQSYLKVECHRAALRPEIYQSGFDQYTQDILNPASSLYDFGPDVVICAIHASRLFPALHDYPFDLSVEERRAAMESGLSAIQSLLDTLTERTAALVLFNNMVVPQHPALGIADWRDDLGQSEMFAHINARLAEVARSRYKNVYIVDEDRVQARSGKAEATDPRLWLTARMAWSEKTLSGLAREYIRYLKPHHALSRKCIVLDMDNTLWGGVIGEDGVDGIQLGPDAPGSAFVAFQRELERLWRRGILLALSSKNNQDDVAPVFEHHSHMVLKPSHFAAQRINWLPKAQNIREIAQELNIGLDSLVFLDDNPVERAKVRAELPQVLTPELPTDPAYYRQALLDLDVFETLVVTEEDRHRNRLYADQKARRDFESQLTTASGSLEDYLTLLDMVVEIEPVNPGSLPRVAQLTNKTNQFNLTTRRYSEARIDEMMARGCEAYTTRVTDRFGDNGIVGVAIIGPGTQFGWEIDTLLLSCRVMGRGIETALLAFLADRVREQGGTSICGWFLPTAKNSPVKDLYQQHAFTLIEQTTDGGELWSLALETSELAVPTYLTLRTPSLV